MSTGSVVGFFIGAFVALGLGGLALVLSIRGLASDREPDITTNTGQQVGRSGLFVFLVLGGLISVAGVALLIAAIKGATHH